MLKKINIWLGKEKVLCIAGLCALFTMAAVPPDDLYSGYIDFRVLSLLFCLMLVVSGFRQCGAFRWLSVHLIRQCHSGRALGTALIILPFFSSMIATNDVALLTFVPFTITLLRRSGNRDALVPVLVLQTIAANLGSMATPVGNPQNIFLYAYYSLSAGQFFSAMMPLVIISFICILTASAGIIRETPSVSGMDSDITEPQHLFIYAVLFIMCLLTVFRLMPCGLLLVSVISVVALTDKSLFRRPDYALLVTFVFFFIVSGNLGRMYSVKLFLRGLMVRSPLLTAVSASQVISNVPAAVLLSGFTDMWKPLLRGVDIGGLGTPVASLASLITLKLYMSEPDSKPGRFLATFTIANAAGLAVLMAAAFIM